MSVLIEHALFFAYVGLALGVAMVSLFWGTQSKITGASVLLASIILANIIYSLFDGSVISFQTLSLIYAACDIMLAAMFFALYRRSNRLERNRWAGVVALIQLFMAATDLIGSGGVAFADRFSYGLMLNLLTIAALVACLVGFTPKSWEEAVGVLRMKWVYFWSDLLMRIKTALAGGWHVNVPRKNNEVAPKEIDAQIGARIREARILHNLSRENLADALGVSVAQIQKYESGTNRVSATTLFAISRLLETDIRRFYEGIEAPALKAAIRKPFG